MPLRVRPQHEEARDLRRVDADDLDSSRTHASRSRHLLAAQREEFMLQARWRLLLPDLSIDLVRALPRPAGGEEVLAALLVRDAEVVPLGAPLLVPEKLGVAFEGRDPAAVAAALRPVDVVDLALVCDGASVVVGGQRRPDPPAVLADHRYRKPPFGVLHACHAS